MGGRTGGRRSAEGGAGRRWAVGWRRAEAGGLVADRAARKIAIVLECDSNPISHVARGSRRMIQLTEYIMPASGDY